MKNKRTINYRITNDEFHYLAGIIDSSSSFYLSKHACGRKDMETGEYSLRWVGGFIIQHTNHNLAKIIKNILFLGDSHEHTLDIKTSGHLHRTMKAIRVCGPILDEILPKLITILKIKKEHAQTILEFRRSITKTRYDQHNPIPQHIEEYRESLKNRISYLNSNEYKDTISSTKKEPASGLHEKCDVKQLNI